MKKTKRWIASVLTAALMITMSACAPGSGGNSQDSEKPSTQDDLSEHVELHFITRPMGGCDAENQVQEMLEEKFNCSINWELGPSDTTAYEQFCVTLISSGEYPDMLEVFSQVNTTSLIPSLVDDGNLIGLKELLNEYGKNILAERPMDEKGMWFEYNDDIYSIPCRNVNVTENGWLIRQDWLDNLGLTMPATVEELTEVARQFTFNDPDKNGKDDTVAFSALDSYQNFFSIPFGIYGGVFDWRKDDSGKYLPWYLRDDSMLPALKLAREWYQMGVVEPDLGVISRNDTLEKRNQNAYGIEWYYLTQMGMSTPWWPAFAQAVPEQKTTYLPVISADGYKGTYPNVINSNVATSEFQLYFFKNNPNPARCIQLIDYFATDEGSDLVYLGPKGVTWDLDADGNYVKKDLSDAEYKASGAQLYYCVYWHNVYKRSADPVVLEASAYYTKHMEKSNVFPYVYDGDDDALNNIVSTDILSIIKDKNVDVESAYQAMKEKFLSMGGQQYVDWYNENIDKA